ncbi:GNAT family N-acetyltransferase [Flavobacterium sp.]|uniref:GNAT family N-acetyltransferase n=1 Tax=Flavobacterium sp. TaxID=239 RepID=UPI001229ABF5|nr:GNAT family N-acetyltransferase [Flavobacterium sp.]RZJ73063.1 MAG: N-acetyltransferase [Flavobacterium sp.]
MKSIVQTFPILTTERLTLRKLSKNDSEEILQLRSDVEINKFLDRKPHETLQEALHFIDGIQAKNANDLLYWAITQTGCDKLIGTICLFDFASDADKCEIGYELLRDHQRQGITTEAAKKVVDYAAEVLEMKSIEAVTHQDNLPSIVVLERLGFKKSGDSAPENPELSMFRLRL